MDLFTRQPGASYVPAFAGRLLLAMANGIARAPDRIKSAFVDEDAEGMWTLAMVVVQWYADNLPAAEAQTIATALRDLGVRAIASNLIFFRERLLPFVKTAHQAQGDAQLAAAGVYFVAAVEQIGLTLLQTALKAGSVRVLQQQILVRLPLPEALKAAYYQALGARPKGTTTPSVSPAAPSRGDRFERADFSPRPARLGRTLEQAAASSVRGQSAPRTQPDSASAESPPPRLLAPNLANAEVARAYLHTLGWEGSDVDRLLQGPDGKRRT